MNRGLMRVLVPAGLALALVASPAFAQFGGASYKFLDAVRKNDGAEVEKALADSSSTLVNTKDVTTGDTALHIVTARRDITWMQFLIYKGADVNVRNDKGVTPLATAVNLGFPEGVELLIGRGARVNDPDSAGETPLIAAVHQRNLEVVRLLLKAGADPRRADSSGRTAQDYAQLIGKDSNIATEIDAGVKAAAARKGQSYGPKF